MDILELKNTVIKPNEKLSGWHDSRMEDTQREKVSAVDDRTA